jgi:hypothetical protein
VWPIHGSQTPVLGGDTCENPDYLAWVKDLQAKGFEIGLHLATFHTSGQEETLRGFEKFHECFGHWPQVLANHADCLESIYWGDRRLNSPNRFIYNVITKFRNRNRFRGHIEGDPLFWGDLCKKYIRYVRNFVYRDINTLKECPFMPYHDPDRPLVNYWFASSEGASVEFFNQTITEENQDRLEAEGGACIMYTHFASGFYQDKHLNQRFKTLMARLSRKKGWFVPVSTLLDYLLEQNKGLIITSQQRRWMERKWLIHKIRGRGTF